MKVLRLLPPLALLALAACGDEAPIFYLPFSDTAVSDTADGGGDTQPDVDEDTIDPDATGDTGEPDAVDPDTGNPDTSEPDTSDPDTSEPDTDDPDISEPDADIECPSARALCFVEGSDEEPSSALSVDVLAVVNCIGRESDDGGSGIDDFEWTVVDSPAGSTSEFVDGGEGEGTYFVDVVGRHVLELTVTNRAGCSDTDVATIVARPDVDMYFEIVWSTPGEEDETDTGFGAGSDVDIHLLHSSGCWGDTSWDCHFGAREPDWGPPGTSGNPTLDIDDTDGSGPEAISFDGPESGVTYTLGAHHFSDIGPSIVTARIYLSGELNHEAEQALEPGEWWVAATVDWPADVHSVDLTYPAVPPCD